MAGRRRAGRVGPAAPTSGWSPASSGCGTPSGSATSTRSSPAAGAGRWRRSTARRRPSSAGWCRRSGWPRLVEVLTDEDALVHATFCKPDGPGPAEQRDAGRRARARRRPARAVVGRRARGRAGPAVLPLRRARRARGRPAGPTSSPAQCRDWAVRARAVRRRRGPRPGSAARSATAGRRRRPATSCDRVLGVDPGRARLRRTRISPALGHLTYTARERASAEGGARSQSTSIGSGCSSTHRCRSTTAVTAIHRARTPFPHRGATTTAQRASRAPMSSGFGPSDPHDV